MYILKVIFCGPQAYILTLSHSEPQKLYFFLYIKPHSKPQELYFFIYKTKIYISFPGNPSLVSLKQSPQTRLPIFLFVGPFPCFQLKFFFFLFSFARNS